jgi:NADH-quinone oxidoreductase subunit N
MSSIIIISLLAIVVLFLGLYKANKALIPVSILGLLASLVLTVKDWGTNNYYYNQMILIDNYAIVFISLTIITTILILLLSKDYFERISTNVAEYIALMLFAMVGIISMISYANLSMLFIGIEIMSVCLYILAGIKKKDPQSNEAALKYFLMGAFATGFLLFGIALIYGVTGTFNIEQIGNALRLSNGNISPIFYAGVLFILVGLGFKVSAAPFHFWTPDVYEGSPTLITTFMASVVKTAGFAAFLRLFYISFAPLTEFLTPTLWMITALTITIGNVVAVYQTSFKRMLAYSSISHAGYMLMAILAMGENSQNAIFLYAAAYSVASIISFGVLIKVKQERGSDHFEAFNGLAKRNPFMAFAMTVSMCSLAGIPLTAGFFGKFFIFSTALSQNFLWLVIIAILNAAIGIYYYFKVIIAMYMKEQNADHSIELNNNYKFVLALSVIATLILGILPGLISSIL